jgi:hypothetical protein
MMNYIGVFGRSFKEEFWRSFGEIERLLLKFVNWSNFNHGIKWPKVKKLRRRSSSILQDRVRKLLHVVPIRLARLVDRIMYATLFLIFPQPTSLRYNYRNEFKAR